MLRALKEKGIIEQIIGSLESQSNLAHVGKSNIAPGNGQSSRALYRANSSSGIGGGRGITSYGRKQLMHMRLMSGKGFLEMETSSDKNAGRIRRDKLVVYCHFGSQRFRSTEVTCCESPVFDDDFILELEVCCLD